MRRRPTIKGEHGNGPGVSRTQRLELEHGGIHGEVHVGATNERSGLLGGLERCEHGCRTPAERRRFAPELHGARQAPAAAPINNSSPSATAPGPAASGPVAVVGVTAQPQPDGPCCHLGQGIRARAAPSRMDQPGGGHFPSSWRGLTHAGGDGERQHCLLTCEVDPEQASGPWADPAGPSQRRSRSWQQLAGAGRLPSRCRAGERAPVQES